VTDGQAATRARRVASLAEAALAQVEATRRAVEQLLAEVREAAPAPVVPIDTASETALDSARLVAIEMAVAGRTREEVGRHVRGAYQLADVEALLDDVFGPPGDARQRRATRFPQR
jgi:alkylhydroperoxidase/carboxymuconolactone decarboxylase family protein YurZ